MISESHCDSARFFLQELLLLTFLLIILFSGTSLLVHRHCLEASLRLFNVDLTSSNSFKTVERIALRSDRSESIPLPSLELSVIPLKLKIFKAFSLREALTREIDKLWICSTTVFSLNLINLKVIPLKSFFETELPR